ncbi:hypothetical protein GCM10023149_22810 [Mucilaginibacter gynuensis]|uniref:PAS domain-containing protein n=2 Tax=Mucilaginibacter gynuensis TaxID=1302236 RepID=A0ABP8GE76_9SPHI
MNFKELEISALFDTTLPRIILRADIPNFTILAYNEAYKHATYTHHRDITGWYLWEAFNPDKGGDGVNTLFKALLKAVETNEIVITEPFYYNIPSVDAGEFTESWWQLDIVPLKGDGGRPAYLLITTNNLNNRIFA